jgi:hypothetical protein
MKKLYRDRVKKQKTEPAFTGHAIYMNYTAALPKRADLVARDLDLVREVFQRLFSEEHFLTLLRAESMTTIPTYLELLLDDNKQTCR